MKFEEIIAAFNTPSQIKVNNLRQHNALLEKQIKANNRSISKLMNKVDKEQDVAANQLDRKCKDWRKILVNNTLKNT